MLFTMLFNSCYSVPQAIRLKTKRVITEGTVLNLPIDIPEPILSFDGKLPPKLKSISCYNSSGFYTIGDDLHIYLEYFSDVVVNGSPKVILNTGCNSPSCVTWEVQSFKCQATRGMFAMQLENEVIMNIDVNTTADRLEQYLRRFQRLHNVSVSIKPGNDNPMNENRVCSDIGNEVFITFFRVDFPEYHGDVPSILLNRFNNNPNPMTRLSQVDSFVYFQSFTVVNCVHFWLILFVNVSFFLGCRHKLFEGYQTR